MATQAGFSLLTEMDISASDTNTENERTKKKAKRQLSNESAELVSPSHMCAYFRRDTKLVTHGDKYRWVSQVLKMAPYNKTKGALELRLGRNNIYVRCKNEEILKRITTTGAAGEILEMSRAYGRGHCTNLVVFDVPREIDTSEITEYNEKIIHAKRIQFNGRMTQRLIITYEGEKIPQTIKIVEGMAPFRCAVFKSLTPFCANCSRWGHGARACPREEPRCRYCAAAHRSRECAEKIAQGNRLPRKCANCRLEHNANSPLCAYYPNDRKNKLLKKQQAVLPSRNPKPFPRLNDEAEFPQLGRINVARYAESKISPAALSASAPAPAPASRSASAPSVPASAPTPAPASAPVPAPAPASRSASAPSVAISAPATSASTSEPASTLTSLSTSTPHVSAHTAVSASAPALVPSPTPQGRQDLLQMLMQKIEQMMLMMQQQFAQQLQFQEKMFSVLFGQRFTLLQPVEIENQVTNDGPQ